MEQMDARYKKHVKQKAGTWFEEIEHFMEEMINDNILSDYFLFVNRDSYLLLSCCDKWEKWNIPEEKIIFADDLLSNVLTNIDFAGKNILLYDVVLNVGRKMFNCYCKLTKLGVEKIRTYVYSVNLEYEYMLELNQKNRPYQPYILKILTQIYFENFARVDTNEAYAFCKQFYKEINRGYVFKSSSKMSILQRYILIIFHEEAYQRYLNGEWNYESKYTDDPNVFYEVMEKVRYLVTLSECDKTKEPTIGQIQNVIRTMCNKWCYFPEEQVLLCQEVVSKVLEFMKELGIIDIIGDIVSFGQNADWLIRGEGKICYLIYEAFYMCISGKYTYDDYLSIVQKYITDFKEEELLYIASEEDRKLFNKTIFDYYVERYQKMDETYVHFAIMRQILWTYNLKEFEKNVHEYTIYYAEKMIADMIEWL